MDNKVFSGIKNMPERMHRLEKIDWYGTHYKSCTFTSLGEGWIRTTSNRGIVSIVNLNLISNMTENTKHYIICKIDLPQRILIWLWTNILNDFESGWE